MSCQKIVDQVYSADLVRGNPIGPAEVVARSRVLLGALRGNLALLGKEALDRLG